LYWTTVSRLPSSHSENDVKMGDCLITDAWCWYRFALRELRLILVTVIRRYEISLVEGQSHEVLLSTTPYMEQGFYNVGFRKRKEFEV
jgi:hypothetical protein